ncbi:Hypothetical_protein [Hexamita inflata]|uniref:Hypothetical_protein n=1 Tax=Hexamita inflata TaxID=28002 RepID=A0AA86RHC4_9EUKA|nr:Hypothetical protein HINF_LOCUS62443 [Hexamita inflata]
MQQLDNLKREYYYKLFKFNLIKVLQEYLEQNQYFTYELANDPSDKLICYATYSYLCGLWNKKDDDVQSKIFLWRYVAVYLSKQLQETNQFDFTNITISECTTAQTYQDYFNQTFQNMSQDQIIDYFDMTHTAFCEFQSFKKYR